MATDSRSSFSEAGLGDATTAGDGSSDNGRNSWITGNFRMPQQFGNTGNYSFFSNNTPTSSSSSTFFSFSRRPSIPIRERDLPYDEPNYVGVYSVWAFLWYGVFLMVPFAYVYIGLILIRELCVYSPNNIHWFITTYIPLLDRVVQHMIQQPSQTVEYWCIIEGCFYIACKLQILWLQSIDPLEASLHSAPMLTLSKREVLWERMMESEAKQPIEFITGWFFDQPIENISRNDVFDFITWSMFEGRNQEHLTTQEFQQLNSFVQKLEAKITEHLYGSENDNDDSTSSENSDNAQDESSGTKPQTLIENDNSSHEDSSTISNNSRSRSKKVFRFHQEVHQGTPPNFFSNLYEGYRRRYETYKEMVENADFHPVQELQTYLVETRKSISETPVANDLRNFASETAQSFGKYEEAAVTATRQTATQMYETLVQPGSNIDKQLHAMSHAAEVSSAQLMEIWNSITKNITKQHLDTAQFLAKKRKQISQQLEGYRNMLDHNMREGMSSMSMNNIPSKQLAVLMRRITECNVRMEKLEARAREAYVKAIEYFNDNNDEQENTTHNNENGDMNSSTARRNSDSSTTPAKFLQTLQQLKEKQMIREPQRYSGYSVDPLLGLATFPLFFHTLILALTEIPLRVWMQKHGFQRRKVGPIAYYYHPGTRSSNNFNNDDDDDGEEEEDVLYMMDDNSSKRNKEKFADYKEYYNNDYYNTPVVFVHGIGVGLVIYIPLIEKLMKLGKPIILPEIPYVTGFRTLTTGPMSVLQPGSVCTTLTAILATHGYLKGNFIGHSYGTTWLSYMTKYSPHQVASLLFLDPICFCLHYPFLTQQFVYKQPDIGTVSYVVRSDVLVNWTIQRSFPWSHIVLFLEDILRNKKQNHQLKKKETESLKLDQHDVDNDVIGSKMNSSNDLTRLEKSKSEDDNDNMDEYNGTNDNIPCSVVLSERDLLVPTEKVIDYLNTKMDGNLPLKYCDPAAYHKLQEQKIQQKEASSQEQQQQKQVNNNDETATTTTSPDLSETEQELQEKEKEFTDKTHFYKGDVNVFVFNNHNHGDWTIDSINFCTDRILDAVHATSARASAQTASSAVAKATKKRN